MNDEVSKLGQSDDDDEVIEGRVVPSYQGPFDWAVYLEQLRNSWTENYLRSQAERDEYKGSYHYFADADGIHNGETLIAPGGWSVPKEQHYDTGNVYKAGKVYVSTDGTDWEPIGTAGGVTYERGPSFTEGWWDEARNLKMEPVSIDFAWDDVSNETFRLLTGHDKNVVAAALNFARPIPVPPVDPDKVKWPEGKDMKWNRTRRQSPPSPYSHSPSYP